MKTTSPKNEMLSLLLTLILGGCAKEVASPVSQAGTLKMPALHPMTCIDSRTPQATVLGSLPNDPTYVASFYPQIAVTKAWSIGTDCSAILVGVLDTGIDYTHPDLAENICTNSKESATSRRDDDGNGYVNDFHGWNFISGNGDAMDDNFHGTHVAGIIGAVGNNSIGTSGICWKANLIPLKFMNNKGLGTVSDAVEAMLYGIMIGTKVLNNSWGTSSYSTSLENAVNLTNTAGLLFIAAAGNDGANSDMTPVYPASFQIPNVISVGASDEVDGLAGFSNYGSTSVHIAAPGVSIYSTLPTQTTSEMSRIGLAANYGSLSGTSMATPHVSASAALVWSKNPGLTALQVKKLLIEKADSDPKLAGKISGNRRLNINNSLEVSFLRLFVESSG